MSRLMSRFTPDYRDGGYTRWTLPAHLWSGSEWVEDAIVVIKCDHEWTAHTECDQCVHRDLSPAEIASVCTEFGLEARS